MIDNFPEDLFIDFSLGNISGVSYEDFSYLTGIKDGSLNNKRILDVGAGISTIGQNLAIDNPDGKFFHLDPIYLNGIFGIRDDALLSFSPKVENVCVNILNLINGIATGENDVLQVEPLVNDMVEEIVREAELLNVYINDIENNTNNGNIYRISGIGENLPVLDGIIDEVIICGFLYASKGPDKVLKEADRVLKDDGQIIIVDYKNSEIFRLVKSKGIEIFRENDNIFCLKLKKGEFEKITSILINFEDNKKILLEIIEKLSPEIVHIINN